MHFVKDFGSPNSSSHCGMSTEQKGQFEVVAILRIIMASMSIMGAFSIVYSAIHRRTVCNPKVHPIFILSIVDTMLSVMWITGSMVWLGNGFETSRIGCFIINLLTVILQCVSMNVTLIYALLAYSSIRQKDFSGAYYVVQGVCPSMEMFSHDLHWAMIQIPQDRNHYLHHLHYYVASYSALLVVNFAVVFLSMALSYCKVLHHIKRMRLRQGYEHKVAECITLSFIFEWECISTERNERSAAYRATQAMILEGQYDAKKRVFLFISIYFVTGITTFILGIAGIVIVIKDYHTNYSYDKKTDHKVMIGIYTFLLCEAGLVPLQGFLNAVAYGWTRGDFLSVMSTQHNLSNLSDSQPHSYGSVNKTDDEDDEDEDSEPTRRLLIPKEREDLLRRDLAITPGTPDYPT